MMAVFHLQAIEDCAGMRNAIRSVLQWAARSKSGNVAGE
jgi:hypothetical protein